MKFIVRKATIKDLPSIYQVERRSYPPELQATHKAIKYRMEIFDIWVAEKNKKIVGFFTCVPAFIPKPETMGRKFLQYRNPHYKKWFDDYRKGKKFNALYITSTAVASNHQGEGIGKTLVKVSLVLAKKYKFKYRVSILRIPGYAEYYKKTRKSAEKYIQEITQGKQKDRFLNLYLGLGFKLGKTLQQYEPDRSSKNFGVIAYKVI
jgi:ribosomal protein S18 acetylase RimI-like enzyme